MEEAAVTVMMVMRDLHLAPDQELVHAAGGGRVEVTGEDDWAVLPCRVCKQSDLKVCCEVSS